MLSVIFSFTFLPYQIIIRKAFGLNMFVFWLQILSVLLIVLFITTLNSTFYSLSLLYLLVLVGSLDFLAWYLQGHHCPRPSGPLKAPTSKSPRWDPRLAPPFCIPFVFIFIIRPSRVFLRQIPRSGVGSEECLFRLFVGGLNSDVGSRCWRRLRFLFFSLLSFKDFLYRVHTKETGNQTTCARKHSQFTSRPIFH